MLKLKKYFLFLLLPIQVIFGQNGPNMVSNFVLPNPPEGDDPSDIPVTKSRLIKIVDSLLSLDEIDPKEVDLISYYNDLLSTFEDSTRSYHHIKLSDLNFYEDLDESVLFPLSNDKDIPESLTIEIESDALSYYTSPRAGVVTSLYGWRDKKMHKGIDIDLIKGDVVVAAFDGKVRIASKRGGYGNVVVIMHPNGMETVYAHLSRIKVKPGQVVLSGQAIGLGGSTGHSTGSHLHFEVRYKSLALNPSTFISFSEHKLLHHTVVLKKSRYGIAAYPSNATFHTVNKGESWALIAKKYGITSKDLCTLNGTQKRYYLKVGQKVRIN
jgi:LysM repeat protein